MPHRNKEIPLIIGLPVIAFAASGFLGLRFLEPAIRLEVHRRQAKMFASIDPCLSSNPHHLEAPVPPGTLLHSSRMPADFDIEPGRVEVDSPDGHYSLPYPDSMKLTVSQNGEVIVFSRSPDSRLPGWTEVVRDCRLPPLTSRQAN